MRSNQWTSFCSSKRMLVTIALAFSGLLIAANNAWADTQTRGKIESTIFAFDGHDFVRNKTTLVTEEGKSAVNTKLDRVTLAYKALIQKRSFIGEVAVFGRKYDAKYAPLIDNDGRLIGALFVAVTK